MKQKKSALEIIVSERKSLIQKARVELMHGNMSDLELALNHALIHVANPSPESLLWIIYYLKKLTPKPNERDTTNTGTGGFCR